MKKVIDCFVVYVFVIYGQNYKTKVYMFTNFEKKLFDRKLLFFLWRRYV